MKHFHVKGNCQTKTLCREPGHQNSSAADAADSACVNNNCEQDVTVRKCRPAAG